jgi:competence protein ComEC
VFPGEVRDIKVTVNLYVPPGEAVPREGETWVCRGWMGRETRDGLFGRRRFWVRGKGSGAQRAEDVSSRFFLKDFVARTRSDFSSRVGVGLSKKTEIEVLNNALLLGERAHIERATREAFANSGMSHLFAVSGLHVLIIAKFLSVLLSFTGFPARFKSIILVPLIWFYVLLVGAGPSAVRAGMMASFCWTAAIFWRKSDPLAAWAQTFALVHIFSPEMLVSTGSQLSFAVMLGLVLWNHIAKGVKAQFVKIFAPTAVAWIFGVPIIAATFAVITPSGLFVNMLAIPIAGFSVVLTALGVISSYISTCFAGFFGAASHMTTSIILGLAHLAGATPWSNFEIEKWSMMKCAAWYIFVSLVMWAIYDYRRRPSVRY